MKKLVIVGVLGVAFIGGGIAVKELLKPEKGNPAAMMARGGFAVPVEVATVESVSWSVTTEAIGTAYANESVQITPNVSDTVDSIHFEDGQQVARGDILVVLNHNEEDAELQAAKANLEEQQREVKRLRGLIASKSVSQSLLDERVTAQETAKYRLAAVEARIKDRYIRAPFSGVLGLRQISVGSYISPGSVITTLDDVATIKLDFSVPAVYLDNLSVGMDLIASTPAYRDREFSGKISSVDSRINVLDRSLKLRAEIPNQDGAIKPGMLMHVTVKWADRPALVVPESAIVQNKDKHFVYLVAGDKTPVAKLQEVHIGVRKPGVVEITRGLEAGQQIISRGTNTARENGPVRIVNRPG